MKQNRFLEIYTKFLQKFLKPPHSLKVVFDCSNGTAGIVLKRIKRPLNSKFYILNFEPNGNFPAHGPDSSKPEAIKQLQVSVQKNKADIGVIFDADADRVLFVDDKSRFIDPDAIARLLVWYLRPKKIVIDSRVGWLIRKFRISNFPACRTGREFRIFPSKIGHPFIEKKMKASQADFGVEHSGHYYFKKFFYLDSGILAALEVINAVSQLPYKFSDFIDLLPHYYRQQINFPLNQLKYKTPASLSKRFGGLRKEFSPPAGGWFNFHFSQTEPLLRLDIEAKDKFQPQKQVLKLKKILL